MTQEEFEKLRTRLEEQLRADVEMLYEAHRVKLRAFETIRRAQAELEGEEIPSAGPPFEGRRAVLKLPAPMSEAPAPAPPIKTRGKAGEVLAAVEEALERIPDEFDKNDLHRALGFAPSRPTLFRALDTLRQEGVLAVAEPGSGRTPSRFRKLSAAAPGAP